MPTLFDRPAQENIDDTLAAVQQRIRRDPQDADSRAMLFQWLAVAGDWARAAKQLKVCAELDPSAQSMAALYEAAIAGECERAATFTGGIPPCPIASAPAWMNELTQALQVNDRLAELNAAALDQAPASAGSVHLHDGSTHDFEWIMDGDSRLGPVCELITGGRYGWLPFSDIARIEFARPQGLCDLVWAHTMVYLRDGHSLPGLMPVRYPAPADGPDPLDDDARLARRTAWTEVAEAVHVGTGQRMWATEHGEYALLDVQALVFAQPAH